MDDEILSIVREQNRDMRSLSKDLSDLAVQVGRHDEHLKQRPSIMAESDAKIQALADRIKSLEAISWKPVVAIVTIVMGVMVIALFLAAGGDPEKVPELLQ